MDESKVITCKDCGRQIFVIDQRGVICVTCQKIVTHESQLMWAESKDPLKPPRSSKGKSTQRIGVDRDVCPDDDRYKPKLPWGSIISNRNLNPDGSPEDKSDYVE